MRPVLLFALLVAFIALLPAAACGVVSVYSLDFDAGPGCTLDAAAFDVPASCACNYDCCTGEGGEGCYVLLPGARTGWSCNGGPTYLMCVNGSFSEFSCSSSLDFGCGDLYDPCGSDTGNDASDGQTGAADTTLDSGKDDGG